MPKGKAQKPRVVQVTDPEMIRQIEADDFGSVVIGFKDGDRYFGTIESVAAWNRRLENAEANIAGS